MITLNQTSFQKVEFHNSKLMGLRFEDLDDFGLELEFEGCFLDYSTFIQMNLKNIGFKSCSLKEVDFTEADASNVLFKECDLVRAVFHRTDLTKADFTSAKNNH